MPRMTCRFEVTTKLRRGEKKTMENQSSVTEPLPQAHGSAHSLPKPTVPEVIPIMRKYAALPGNSVGGSLHIVLDDGNVDDDSVLHCIKWAHECADVAGVKLGEILLRMSRTQRKKLCTLFYAPNKD